VRTERKIEAEREREREEGGGRAAPYPRGVHALACDSRISFPLRLPRGAGDSAHFRISYL
jgi:hypothetical protein